ncbi:MAG: hypothetical protein M3069_04690 [Chloroflexota bacterium]|nr:hypothetical protein [Chloroflexota bacterium]
MLTVPVRRTARWLGVGRALLKVRGLHALTVRGAVSVARGKTHVLPRILRARPIPTGDGPVEVHMLLHHQRILEGIWALYSFAYFSQVKCQIFVHSDGSLTDADAGRLQRVLPGVQVISRTESDQRVEHRLRELGLARSLQFRDSLVFALKLFDPFFFGDHSSFILLDSDVLFFRRPAEVLPALADPSCDDAISLYSPDNGFRYCLSAETLQAILGQPCIASFNPGVVRARRAVLDLPFVEQCLQRAEFWGSGTRPHYYAELTLWAMQLTTAGARSLPPTYAITPPLDGPPPVSGHYCGGGYPATWFYSRGLPQLAREFGLDQIGQR